MNIAEISVKRPVFAIMMTAALIVLGAFSYRVARPRPDAEDRRAGRVGAGQPARRQRRGDRDPDHQARSRRRSTRSAASTSCAPPPIRAARASRSPSRSSATSSRPRRTCATSWRRSSASSRATRGRRRSPRWTPTRSRSSASRCSGRGAGKELTEIAEKQIKQELETVKDVGVGRLQRRAQARDPAAAQRRPPQRLRPDRRPGAHRRRAAERRDARAAVHRRPRRGRAAHDGPHQERRGLQPHRHLVPRDGSVITFADVGRVQDTDQEVRSATRLERRRRPSACRCASSRAPTPSKWSTASWRGCSASRRTLPAGHPDQHRQRPVALHPAVVRGHQAAPDPRRPAGQRRGVPVHPQPARHASSPRSRFRPRSSAPSPFMKIARLHAEQHDDARALAGDRHRHRRRDRRAREHLPVRRGEGRHARRKPPPRRPGKSAWRSWRRRCRWSSSSCRSRS